MAQIIGSPSKYIQGNGELARLYQHIEPMAKTGVYIVASPSALANYADTIENNFKGQKLPLHIYRFGGECSKNEIECILNDMKGKNIDLVVGIGGGKAMDTAKAVAYYAGFPVVICPSIASSDAPCSALSVLYTDDGLFDQYLPLPQNPAVVLVDTNIVANAPVRFLVSGIGDALATYFEARACIRSSAIHMQGGTATNAAFTLSKRCYEILLEDGYKAKLAVEQNVVTKSVENIIEANTYLSGLGFESCGLAAAHALHNGLTALEETHTFTHGEKVAFGTLVQLVLENAPAHELDTVLVLCKKLGLPTCLEDLGIKNPDRERLMAVARLACAEGDTMANMPFTVTPDDVLAAILATDSYGK